MTKMQIVLATVAALTLSAPVFAADMETKTNTETTDAAGTTTSTKQKAEVSVDAAGNVDKTVKTVQTKDPKGLFNKSKVKTKESEHTSADGSVTTSKKVVDGHTESSSTVETK